MSGGLNSELCPEGTNDDCGLFRVGLACARAVCRPGQILTRRDGLDGNWKIPEKGTRGPKRPNRF